MKKQKSAVSWMRKELNVKGKTLHSGRGSYSCSFDIEGDKLVERVKEKIVKWKESGLVEEVEENKDYLTVKLIKNYFENDYYRTFCFSKIKNYQEYGCLFSL